MVSKNKLPLSWLIRNVTKEPASHFSICFDNKLVFHSSLTGAHPVFRTTFEKKNEIIKEVLLPATRDQEDAVYDLVYKFDGKPYDYGALIYFSLALATGNIPEKNPWSNRHMYLCTEIANCLKPVIETNYDLAMHTPWFVINDIQKRIYG